MTVNAAVNLPASMTKDLSDLFKLMDVDHKGTLSREEFFKALQSLGVTSEKANKVVDAVTLNRSGGIEWSEFVAALLPACRELFAAAVHTAFQDFDLNHDQCVDREDVLQMLQRMQQSTLPVSPEAQCFAATTADMMMREMKGDDDGKIYLEDFVSYFDKSRVSPSLSASACKPMSRKLSDVSEFKSPARCGSRL